MISLVAASYSDTAHCVSMGYGTAFLVIKYDVIRHLWLLWGKNAIARFLILSDCTRF